MRSKFRSCRNCVRACVRTYVRAKRIADLRGGPEHRHSFRSSWVKAETLWRLLPSNLKSPLLEKSCVSSIYIYGSAAVFFVVLSTKPIADGFLAYRLFRQSRASKGTIHVRKPCVLGSSKSRRAGVAVAVAAGGKNVRLLPSRNVLRLFFSFRFQDAFPSGAQN